MPCPRCQYENPPHAKFCLECGARQTLSCSKCGAELPGSPKFCLECGEPVGPRIQTRAPESYTPKHLAERIINSKAALEGERKQITVLFADLKGSMEMLADRDPEEARKVLDPVLERMMEAVHHFEGTVNQVMGDGIMALFGAPIAHEDHAVRACYAALRMQERVRRYSEELRQARGQEVRIRVGLNSGDVVVRSIGSDLHMDYSAVGQATHLAARMEQLAPPGSIYATPTVQRLVEGRVTARAVGPTAVKGFSDPVDVWEITGTATASPFEVPALTPFLGRDEPMRQLVRAVGLAEKSEGQVVAVVGDAGVGKSRLVWEFLHQHLAPGWTVLRGRSVSYGKATAYLPIVDLLKRGFQIAETDTDSSIATRVRQAMVTLGEAFAPDVPALLAVLGVLSDDRQWEQLDPPQRRERIIEALRRLTLRLAVDRPVLLILEDLHWIDDGTQGILDALVDAAARARILILVNYRPEYRHPWAGESFYAQIRLDPLSREICADLLDSLLGRDLTLTDLRRELVDRTQGNPFFLEESIRHLVESGVLDGAPGERRRIGPARPIDIPVTVQGVLAARIDRLSAEDKRLLQAAAVVGKEVPLCVLEAVAEVRGPELRRALSRLQGAELLRDVGTFPEPIYVFQHALTHEVTYGTLLTDRRQALHAVVLSAMEQLYAARLTEHAEVLAQHALAGGVRDKAVDYLREASVKAYRRGVITDALVRAEEAVEISNQLPPDIGNLRRRVDVMLELWGPLAMSAQFARLDAMTQTLVADARVLDDRGRLGLALLKRGAYVYVEARYEELEMCSRQAFECAAALDPLVRLHAPVGLGMASDSRGDYRAAIDHLKSVADGPEAELAKRRDRYSVQASPYIVATSRLAWACARIGEFQSATAYAARGIEAAAELGTPVSLAVTNLFKALALSERGAFAEAVIASEAAVQQCEAHGVLAWLPPAYAVRGYAQVHVEPSVDALAQVERGATMHAFIGVKTFLSWITRLWAETLFVQGVDDEASNKAEAALALSRQYGERGEHAEALRLLADIALTRHELTLARTRYSEAVALAEQLGMRPLVARCELGLGQSLRAAGRHSEAKERLEAAVTMLGEMGMTYWLEMAERELRASG